MPELLTLTSGQNTIDWTKSPLKWADFDSNNAFNIGDISQFIGAWDRFNVPTTPVNEKFDINFNGNIDFTDISLLLSAWISSSMSGDN
jgi:hypothetical protein